MAQNAKKCIALFSIMNKKEEEHEKQEEEEEKEEEAGWVDDRVERKC